MARELLDAYTRLVAGPTLPSFLIHSALAVVAQIFLVYAAERANTQIVALCVYEMFFKHVVILCVFYCAVRMIKRDLVYRRVPAPVNVGYTGMWFIMLLAQCIDAVEEKDTKGTVVLMVWMVVVMVLFFHAVEVDVPAMDDVVAETTTPPLPQDT